MIKPIICMIVILLVFVSCKRENKVSQQDVQNASEQKYSELSNTNKFDNLLNFIVEIEKVGKDKTTKTREQYRRGEYNEGDNFTEVKNDYENEHIVTSIAIWSPKTIINGIGIGSKKEDVLFQFGNECKTLFTDFNGKEFETDIEYDLRPDYPIVIIFQLDDGVVVSFYYQKYEEI